MIELLVATENAGKLREYRQLLKGLPVTIVGPAEKGLSLAVAETGSTFAENARLKATAYARASGLLSLADDSGLEVDALDGAPGVYSARYAGPDASDAERIALLLHNMRKIPMPERTARFRCVIAVADPAGVAFSAEGTCEGYISLAPEGEHGFGYDPIFYLPQLGKTMAQITPAVKNRLSHRSRAAKAIFPLLLRLVQGQASFPHRNPSQ